MNCREARDQLKAGKTEAHAKSQPHSKENISNITMSQNLNPEVLVFCSMPVARRTPFVLICLKLNIQIILTFI